MSVDRLEVKSQSSVQMGGAILSAVMILDPNRARDNPCTIIAFFDLNFK